MDSEVLKRSVTRDDATNGLAVFRIFENANGADAGGLLPPYPPAWWSHQRDAVLAATPFAEGVWADAVAIATSKMASLGWTVESDVPLRARTAQTLMQMVEDGAGWTQFMQMHLADYLTTDNGAFIEVVRATSGAGSRVLGLMHLDSLRCTRTGDPEYPVLYRDNLGREHAMRPWQVISITDSPSPRASYHGVGRCSASRAYQSIYHLAAARRFLNEKISGRQSQAIYFLTGVTPGQLRDVIATSEAEANGQRVVNYKGATIVPVGSDQQPDIATIALASLPDGFNRREEYDIALLEYTNAIGLDPQDLQPLTRTPLGSSTQSEVLDQKSRTRGLAAWRVQFVHMVNHWVLPERTTFAFSEADLKQQEHEAKIKSQRVEWVTALVAQGVINEAQALQVLVDYEDLPKEFITVDVTSEETLQDDEKPGSLEPKPATPEPTDPAEPEQPGEVTKALDMAMQLIESELDAGQTLGLSTAPRRRGRRAVKGRK